MKYNKLGNSGLDVSRICLGCMGFGEESGGMQDWSIDEAASRPIIERALELGINFFDTANAYSLGSSEEIVGRALRDMANRDEVVIATKVYFPMHRGRNARGLSRKSIMAQLDASLRRLGTDYIDLYQIHRWDDRTPVEETLGALHDVVACGKVRYIGASSMWAWQFSKALYTSEMRGLTRFVSMQNQYSLLQREEEREMLPLCADQGVGAIPWSPLGRGPAHSRLGIRDSPFEERPGDRGAVQRGQGPAHRRARGRGGTGEGRLPGPSGLGLGAGQPRRRCPDRRRHQDESPGGGGGGP